MDARARYFGALAQLERAVESFALAGVMAADAAAGVGDSPELDAAAMSVVERCRLKLAGAVATAPALRHLFP